ncbi:hypothetical protein [Pseudomonas piscis]|uniref:hypothetical protein n=1 Tax=Pseudomonas piscis TaxID=2614538 RepID=UPI0021D5EF77|nr:hypothetical protein [Pseudomonas piscis]MCU7649717.1 hypothetical protein [Pseudomonas piscis]
MENSRINFSARRVNRWALVAIIMMLGCMGQARALEYGSIINGYRDFTYVPGQHEVTLTIDWKAVPSKDIPSDSFISHVLGVYVYDKNGAIKSDQKPVQSARMNWSGHTVTQMKEGMNWYTQYHLPNEWTKRDQFSTTVQIELEYSAMSDWHGVSVRAGNLHGNLMGDLKLSFQNEVAYITRSDQGGSCRILIDPGIPPPPEDLRIRMTAPDWDLGELEGGRETTKTFLAPNDQLCLDYKGNNFISGYQQYIIDASNRNGLSANTSRYLLKHSSDAQAPGLPYHVTLNENATSVMLPNTAKRGFKLNQNGTTCFIPTINVTTEKNAKGGHYDDILTFTIIAKP